MEAVSHITNFVTSKARIQNFEDQVVSSVKDGITNPLKIQVYLKSFIKAGEGILNRISEDVLIEAEKHGKSFEAHGARVDVSELGIKYDYEHCQDKDWERLNSEFNNIAEKKKDRETFLKTLKKPITVVDEETGETWKINPPIRKSTTGVKITIK